MLALGRDSYISDEHYITDLEQKIESLEAENESLRDVIVKLAKRLADVEG